jgi:hypothetical protein
MQMNRQECTNWTSVQYARIYWGKNRLKRQNRTGKTGQEREDIQKRTGRIRGLNRTGQAEQDKQNRTGRTGQAEQERQDKTGRMGGSDCLDRIWQPEKDSQNGTGRTRLPWQEFKYGSQDCQDRAARIGLLAQDCKDWKTRAEQKGEDSQKRTGMQGSETTRTGQSEWDRQNKIASTELPAKNCQKRTASTGLLK